MKESLRHLLAKLTHKKAATKNFDFELALIQTKMDTGVEDDQILLELLLSHQAKELQAELSIQNLGLFELLAIQAMITRLIELPNLDPTVLTQWQHICCQITHVDKQFSLTSITPIISGQAHLLAADFNNHQSPYSQPDQLTQDFNLLNQVQFLLSQILSLIEIPSHHK